MEKRSNISWILSELPELREKGKKFYTFTLPFEQYFVNEFKAPLLEEELRKRSSKNKNMILTVRFFKDGVHAVSSLTYP